MTGAPGARPRPPGTLAVAHRAGNSVAELRTALDAGVDLVELDVHRYRGLLEARHHKAAGPRHLWEPGSLVRPADLAVAEPGEILAEARGWMLDEFAAPVRRILSVGSRVGLERLRRRLSRTRVDGVISKDLALLAEVISAR